jgi:hypothetical protein
MDVEVRASGSGIIAMIGSPRMGVAQKNAENTLHYVLGGEEAEQLIANRILRDGDDAHITVLNPMDGKRAVDDMSSLEDISEKESIQRIEEMARVIPDNWRAKGIGRVDKGDNSAFYVAVTWPAAEAFCEALGLDPHEQPFHITVGFGDDGDVHGGDKTRVLPVGKLKRR